MGACDFFTRSSGDSPKDAFRKAVSDAKWESGHGGYTGTIAEKDSFVVILPPEGKDPEEYADELMAAGDPRVDDKWGPAGCIELPKKDDKEQEYLFFGTASS